MPKLFIQESFINRTEGHRTGESPVYESFTDSVGQLYKSLTKEHGRCMGKVYIDVAGRANPLHVGWTFVRRMKYDDCNETFLSEAWVTIHESMPETKVTYHYKDVAK